MIDKFNMKYKMIKINIVIFVLLVFIVSNAYNVTSSLLCANSDFGAPPVINKDDK